MTVVELAVEDNEQLVIANQGSRLLGLSLDLRHLGLVEGSNKLHAGPRRVLEVLLAELREEGVVDVLDLGIVLQSTKRTKGFKKGKTRRK